MGKESWVLLLVAVSNGAPEGRAGAFAEGERVVRRKNVRRQDAEAEASASFYRREHPQSVAEKRSRVGRGKT